MKKNKGLQLIALLEGFKGVLALLVAVGVHAMAGDNIEQAAERLVTHFHLNPASEVPHAIIHAASELTGPRMTLLAVGVVVYAVVRLVEAYGLWHHFRWTEWLALVSGGIYLPIELYEIITHPGWLTAGALAINVIVVLYMYRILRIQQDEKFLD